MMKNIKTDTFSKKTKSMSTLGITLICIFSCIVGITLAFFASGDFASSHVGMSGKVLIEAVGSGDKSIEDTPSSSNLEIKLQDNYSVLIPGMEIEIIANCKVYKSTTKPLLRAKLDVNLEDNLTGEVPADEMNIVSDIYSQLIEKIEGGDKWYLHTDSYFYYIGENSPEIAASGGTLLEEIDATKGDFVVDFIPEAIIFPTFVDRTYSGLGLQFKITFQAIQNYITDDNGNQLPNTIDNCQKIFCEFANDDLPPPTPLEYFITSIDEDGNIVLDIKEGAILPETITLPSYDSNGDKITKIGTSFAADKTIKNIIVPSGYTEIDSLAFYNNKTIQTIDLSRTQITEIPPNTFILSSLKSIELPDTLKTIAAFAFAYSSL